ncbi:MAG TPA: DUF2016 domain-containing protein [Smithellaceae bacterium]|nr:MAG: hypothetical protein BWY15_02317 [Firmicutes bacterium ADurb.Bin193]HNQ63118.1 DUF2016 domain-containing protein [Syntrophorhabdaceae bacterium]HNS55607.1 DUF2016 domain-containing protein [Smithellaceae bacterium]
MNRLDQIIQKHMPVVIVPTYGELDILETGKTRFLMGKDGLYLETKQPWGSLTRKLWEAPRYLPYGWVLEEDGFAEVLAEATDVIKDTVVPLAAKYAREGKEYAGFIAWHPSGYEYVPVDFTSTLTNVMYKAPMTSNGAHIAIDIHSHGEIRPFFSQTDDADDAGGVKICVVLGNYRRSNGSDIFDAAVRYSVEGFRFYHGPLEKNEEEDGDEA